MAQIHFTEQFFFFLKKENNAELAFKCGKFEKKIVKDVKDFFQKKNLWGIEGEFNLKQQAVFVSFNLDLSRSLALTKPACDLLIWI